MRREKTYRLTASELRKIISKANSQDEKWEDLQEAFYKLLEHLARSEKLLKELDSKSKHLEIGYNFDSASKKTKMHLRRAIEYLERVEHAIA